jgi:O-methyltransferase involved in polyketide biosynthesis
MDLWPPEWTDLERPHAGRVFDYFLGGAYNFGPDRELARRALELEPGLRVVMRAQRMFLRRVVRFLLGAGIRQFVDLGAGLPTSGNVYNVVRETDSRAPIICVDIDPVTVAHSQMMLADDGMAAAFQGDLREPQQIMAHDDMRRLIDPKQPVAVMLIGVLHFIRDEEDPAGIVAWLRDAIAPGSYIAIGHGTNEGRPKAAEHQSLYARNGAMIRLRSRAEVEPMVAGLDLVGPGLVRMSVWSMDPDQVADIDEPIGFGALGRTV